MIADAGITLPGARCVCLLTIYITTVEPKSRPDATGEPGTTGSLAQSGRGHSDASTKLTRNVMSERHQTPAHTNRQSSSRVHVFHRLVDGVKAKPLSQKSH